MSNITKPAIGTLRAGRAATVNVGEVSGAQTVVIDWLRGGTTVIPGADGERYAPSSDDVGQSLDARVRAISASGAVTTVVVPVTAEVLPDPDDETDNGGSGGGVDPGDVPEGLMTVASPATLPLHLGMSPDYPMTVTVTAVGASQITYGYSATGALIIHNATPAAGVSITNDLPAAVMEADRGASDNAGKVRAPGLANGMTLNQGFGGLRERQGIDGGIDKQGVDGIIPFDSSLMVAPSLTGVPLIFTRGDGGGHLDKYRAIPVSELPPGSSGNWRPMVRDRGSITVVESVAAGRGMPFINSPADPVKNPRFYTGDLNFEMLPSLPLVANTPDNDAMTAQANRLQFLSETTYTRYPAAERLQPLSAGENYRSYRVASNYSPAALACCLEIPEAVKRRLFYGLVQNGIVQARTIVDGGKYNTNVGLGGIMAGSKFLIAIAALATEDSELLEIAGRNDYSSESRQTLYVVQNDIDNYNYKQIDLGAPEWMQNPVEGEHNRNRRIQGWSPTGAKMSNYRHIFHQQAVPTALTMQILPGGRALWDHAPFFDYADRVMANYWHRDGGRPVAANQATPNDEYFIGDPFAVGFQEAFATKPSLFARSMWTAYRNVGGPMWGWT